MSKKTRLVVLLLVLISLLLSACEAFVEEEPTFTPGPTVPVLVTEPGLPETGGTPIPTEAAPTSTATPATVTETPTEAVATPAATATRTPDEATETEVTSTPTEAGATPILTEAPATPTTEASPTPMVDAEALISRGENIYLRNCSTCHQANGQGVPGTFPALAGNPSVTQTGPVPVIRQVLFGGGGMPAFANQLSNRDVAAVVSYIRNAWDNNASVVAPQQVRAVREESE